ncbi:MAG: CocE/NonD family hydrolase [Defluviimonas sp.]|uniref:CocE/NonD family hydrolase n=1 Tax=Albidovulum sp. TaxID=1872424 RepID=UPI001DF3ACB5|nr:CocE/NonD family hydrolase [Paracoccaceae bacterium]MCC0064009.1 CocE/NonD family hydrolase [Defluviimonas sp.]
MRTVERFPHAVDETPDTGIVLADGTRLSARVWMPAGPGPFPAVLEFLPYRKRDGTTVRDALTHPWFAGHGLACLRVDMRGNGDSEGLMEDEYSPRELADAVEVIDWIAAQPWSNGRVGMMGISWGGFNSLQVAALAPEPLKAIVTLCSTVDRYADDIHYKGGCLLNENLGWGATMWAYSSRPPDPALRQGWHEMWQERLAAEPFLPALWLRHQNRDAYWKHGSVCENYGAIKAAVLAVGGWGDSYKNAVPALVQNIAAPVKGIVGPWVHKYPHFAVPEPRIGFLQEALRWWRRWLAGAPDGVEDEPAYRVYLMDGVRPASWYDHRPGRWIAEPAWPAPGITTETLVLGDGTLGTGTGTGAGGPGAPFRVTVASPQDCGMDGGEFCAIWLGPEMPGDQRRDDALSATFDSAPMAATDIVGAPVVRLRLTPDKPVAQIAVRLNHVHPDGAATRITWGVLNLCRAGSMEHPEPLVPGREIEIALALDHIAYRLPEGHALRLSVSTSYWPMVWPVPEAATLVLSGGSVDLPVRAAGGAGDEVRFEPAEAAPALQAREIRPGGHVRRTEIDQRTGIVSLIIEDDFGEAENLDHGLIAGSVARERWDIHPDDPLSARGQAHWSEVVERDGIRLRTEARCSMRSDAQAFHLDATLQAFENEVLVFETAKSDTIPRDHR